MIKRNRRFYLPCLVAAVPAFAILAATPADADFFDDARRTFTTDIPHFFQDDIPCAFGGQPTSHTKSSCKSPNRPDPAHRTPAKAGNPVPAPPGKANQVDDASTRSER